MEGVNWLKKHAENEAFSFVFKCDNVQLNGKDVRWNNYTKPIQNEELTSLIRGAQTAMDQTEEEEMDWESEVDSLAKKQVQTFDALIKKCLFEVFVSKNIEPNECVWFIQHEWGKDQGWHCHVLLHSKNLQQATGKWLRRQMNMYWSRWLVTLCSVNLTPTEKIKLREIAEDSEWVTILTYRHKQTKKDYVKMVHFGNMIAYYFFFFVKK